MSNKQNRPYRNFNTPVEVNDIIEESASEDKVFQTTPDSLNVREEPTGRILFTIPKYSKVIKLSEEVDGTWTKVCLFEDRSKVGYVVSDYISEVVV